MFHLIPYGLIWEMGVRYQHFYCFFTGCFTLLYLYPFVLAYRILEKLYFRGMKECRIIEIASSSRYNSQPPSSYMPLVLSKVEKSVISSESSVGSHVIYFIVGHATCCHDWAFSLLSRLYVAGLPLEIR